MQHNVFLTEFKDAQMQEPCLSIASVAISESNATLEIRCVICLLSFWRFTIIELCCYEC